MNYFTPVSLLAKQMPVHLVICPASKIKLLFCIRLPDSHRLNILLIQFAEVTPYDIVLHRPVVQGVTI
jgi:hypothetical protein